MVKEIQRNMKMASLPFRTFYQRVLLAYYKPFRYCVAIDAYIHAKGRP